MGGEETEKLLLEREYASMIKHENRVLTRRWWFNICEEGVIKWLWGSFGVCGSSTPMNPHFMSSLQLVVCAIPVFFKIPGAEHFDLGSRTEGGVVRAIFV